MSKIIEGYQPIDKLDTSKNTSMSKIKEFEELPLGSSYLINAFKTNDKFSMAQTEYIEQAQKDAWNAAIRRAADDCIFYCDKQLVLTQLIDD